MQENGVMGNVGTSLVFNTDSTVIVYKGVAIDTTVIINPYIFAYGNYEYKEINKMSSTISLNATKEDGSSYTYVGQYNKKKGLMILNIPDSKLKETFILNPDAKINIK